ncbi:threonine/serine dehydratase [Roseococcus sp. DSY-14]|uniref:threonine ammonia-lyase n=1 Tax=Roseococcus sp. DSY-14 TaxID=3369650 RepID=UPI00387B324F
MTPGFAEVQAAAARIAGRVRRTPLLRHRALDQAAGRPVWVKPEPLQATGSFKLRGATNALLLERPRAVVTHSSGNHGQAVACAAAALGIPALVAMPADAPQVKVAATRAWGAEIHPFDRHGVDRDALAARLAAGRGAVVIPPFDHPAVIAGQGTAVLEALEDMEAAPADILVCTGGGGLLAGSALAAEGRAPAARLWAVEPEGWDDYGRSLRAGRRLANDGAAEGYCDALLSRAPGEITFAVNAPRVAGGLAVGKAQVQAAMRFAFTHLKLVVEPGGAVALAALLAGLAPGEGPALVVLSGGNVDPATFAEALAAA